MRDAARKRLATCAVRCLPSREGWNLGVRHRKGQIDLFDQKALMKMLFLRYQCPWIFDVLDCKLEQRLSTFAAVSAGHASWIRLVTAMQLELAVVCLPQYGQICCCRS